MSAWPPPADESSVYAEQVVYEGSNREKRRLRQVRLWGRDVWVDDASERVWCHGCLELVTVDELAAVNNGHPVGTAYRAQRTVPPMTERDDPPAPRRPFASEMPW